MTANQLALYYHSHYSQETADLPFWLLWVDQQGGPILELGCGSGRILRPLAEEGYTVYGIDNDKHMLSFAQSTLTDEVRKHVILIRADMRYTCLTARFPLVILPCNTYSTVDVQQRPLVLNRVRFHLAAGGVFVLSMPNPLLLAELPHESDIQIETTFPHPQGGDPVQVSSQWSRDMGDVLFDWHYDRLFPDGRVERQTISVRHYLQELGDIFDDFSRAGFREVSTMGDYDRSGFGPDSPYLIIAARA